MWPVSASDLFSIDGKTALVTGGTRGIGKTIAEGFVDAGATVFISSRRADACAEVAEELSKKGTCIGIPANLSTEEGCRGLADELGEQVQRLDVLVNNAGATWGAPAEDYPAEAWHKVMDLNVNGLFFVTQEVGRRCMIPKRAGKIVNIASVSGLSGNALGVATIAYNASKGAVVNFTRALAAEWGKYNINVNAICPGFFPSKMSQGLLAQIAPSVIAATPLQRLGGDEDLKGAIVFLASEASRHITGQYIAVDGGASIA